MGSSPEILEPIQPEPEQVLTFLDPIRSGPQPIPWKWIKYLVQLNPTLYDVTNNPQIFRFI